MRLKGIERNRSESERRVFNEQAEQSKEAERAKDMSYKNVVVRSFSITIC